MHGEADDVKVVRWEQHLLPTAMWLRTRAPLVTLACLFLVLVYGWSWAFVLWPLSLAVAAILLVSGFERVRVRPVPLAQSWIYVSCLFDVPSSAQRVAVAGRQCPVCETKFDGHTRKRYCSSTCRRRADYVRHADARRTARLKRYYAQKASG